MTARRIEAGPLVALLGAVVLFVSLFLDFYDPGLTAWDVFEVLDLVLAAAAAVGAVAAASLAGAPVPALDARVLAYAAGTALVLVVATLLNHPPAVSGAQDPALGLWLALGGSALMAVGALLSVARVHVTLNVEGRRTRVAAVDARRREEAAAAEAEAARTPEPPDARAAAPKPAAPTRSKAARAARPDAGRAAKPAAAPPEAGDGAA